jgi:hypothetical protein
MLIRALLFSIVRDNELIHSVIVPVPLARLRPIQSNRFSLVRTFESPGVQRHNRQNRLFSPSQPDLALAMGGLPFRRTKFPR